MNKLIKLAILFQIGWEFNLMCHSCIAKNYSHCTIYFGRKLRFYISTFTSYSITYKVHAFQTVYAKTGKLKLSFIKIQLYETQNIVFGCSQNLSVAYFFQNLNIIFLNQNVLLLIFFLNQIDLLLKL